MRRQKTLRHVIGCVGVGLHSGVRVGLTLRPADAGSGIRFRRVDRPTSSPIPARLEHVREVREGTSLGLRAAPSVRTIEHLMAALAACEIDNVLVETSGPELPAMDGSALPFVLLIECAGTVEQDRLMPDIELLRPVGVTACGRYARLEPAAGLELVVEHAEGAAAASRPFSLTVSAEACKRELVGARDQAGRAAAGGGRFADEPARHAALDALGDLALLPARLRARYVDGGADSVLRRLLLRRLMGDPSSWRLSGGLPPPALALAV
jgi:UDP-3-O-[3-hydroxymyristoyl] N-acetylglucosamine deacetylase